MPRTKHTKEDIANKLQILRDVNREEAERFVDEKVFGRNPYKYDKNIHPRETLVLMAQGASKLEVACEMGVHRDTVLLWEDKYNEYAAAIQLGLELSEAWWRKAGRENILNPYFNSQLWMMNMSNRFGWTRRVEGSIHTIAVQESEELAELKAANNPDKDKINGNINIEEQEALLGILIEAGVFEEAVFEEVENPSARRQLSDTKMG